MCVCRTCVTPWVYIEGFITRDITTQAHDTTPTPTPINEVGDGASVHYNCIHHATPVVFFSGKIFQ